jgi:hypothetical protein
MKHKAIYDLYSEVVTITEDSSTCVAYDANGNVVSWDADAVATKQTELENARKLENLRTERNSRLAETDHWTFSDTPTMTQAQQDYRQDLRDITDTYSDLDSVVWPTKP